MAEAQYLRANTGVADPVLFSRSPQSSLFWPKPWVVSTNVVKVQTDIPSQSNATPGNEVVYEPEKVATFVSLMHLRWRTSAINVAGSTYARFCDFAGVGQIERIQLLYDSNELKDIYPEEYAYHYYNELDLEHQRSFEQMVGGNLTDAQRSALATGEQQFTLPILLPNYYSLRNAIPITVLSQRMRIRVRWATEGTVVQTDAPANIAGSYTFASQPILRVTNINTTGLERAGMIERARTASGLNYLQTDFVYTRRQIMAANLTNDRFRLSNINGPVAVIGFIARPTVYVDSNTGNPDPFRLVPEDWASSFMGGTGSPLLVNGNPKPTGGVISTWGVTSSNNRITPVLERDWSNNVLHGVYWKSIAAPNFQKWTYSNQPCHYTSSLGSMNYAQINEPIGDVQLVTALVNSAYYIDWMGLLKNFIQYQGGAVIRTFTS